MFNIKQIIANYFIKEFLMNQKDILKFILDMLVKQEYIIKTGKGTAEKWYVQVPLDLDGKDE